MHELTITGPLVGGAAIGLSASLLLLFNGKIAGISGIVGGLLVPKAGDIAWRAAFVAGLLFGGALLVVAWASAFPPPGSAPPLGRAVIAGLLVGYGARLGNGCTSGHGVCGLARLSVRSLVATLTFIAAGAVSVYVSQHVFGGVR